VVIYGAVRDKERRKCTELKVNFKSVLKK
jgi:hypothetical protein